VINSCYKNQKLILTQVGSLVFVHNVVYISLNVQYVHLGCSPAMSF